MSKVKEMFVYLNQLRDLPGYDEIFEEAKNECLCEFEVHADGAKEVKCPSCSEPCGNDES